MMSELKSEFIFELDIAVDTMHAVGDCGKGSRWVAAATGGTFNGPQLRGTVLTPGGDFGLIRTDGVTEHDIRAVLRTDDDARIFMHYHGLHHQLALQPGQETSAATPFYFRIAARFETGAKKYQWLNRVLAVGVPRLHELKENFIPWRMYALL